MIRITTTFQENIPDIVYSRTSPTKKKAVKPPSNKPPYTVGLSNYYVEVFTYRTLFHKVLSSPHMLTLRSDCDCHELSALLTLLGPNGMHYLDTKLLKNMSALGSYTINQCQHYMSLLTVSPESLSSNFTSYLVKMKNIDEIFQKTCAFGIMNDIRNLYFKLYFRNFRFKPIANLLSACITYGSIVSPKTIEEDALANKLFRKAQSLNINNNIDSALVQQSDFIRALQPSQETYVSLTTYLALLICYVSTKEIFKYIPYADANVNNAQGIVGAIHAILTKSMTKFSECSKKQCQLLEQTTFSLASSWLLHSLVNRATATKETNAIYSDSAFMVLSKLGDISGKMGQDWLETYIGTALFQTIHSKLLRRRFLKLQNSEIDKEQEKGLSEVMA
ncbi:hypothetical protein HMI56_003058 [Coelomomyces lativittatus]|nr:hypothetical protein HMI56_003058 [Coelomomyces lativittatus]